MIETRTSTPDSDTSQYLIKFDENKVNEVLTLSKESSTVENTTFSKGGAVRCSPSLPTSGISLFEFQVNSVDALLSIGLCTEAETLVSAGNSLKSWAYDKSG